MRKLATVEVILDVQPIENANRIEVAKIRGWKVVVRKGEFQPGDICVYFEVDSVLPEDERFKFLADSWNERMQGYRLKTRRMRGQISQGLAMPVSTFPEIEEPKAKVGEDVTELLGVRLYEPPRSPDSELQAAGSFPSFVPKTDEERVQNVNVKDLVKALDAVYGYDGMAYTTSSQDIDLTNLFIDQGTEMVKGGPHSEDPMIAGSTYFVTEKLDGTSFTCFIREGEWGLCSRNRMLKYEPGFDNKYARIIDKHNLKEKMFDFVENHDKYAPYGYPKNFVIQGELCGPGIQKNKHKLQEEELFVFSIFDIDQQEYVAIDTQLQMVNLFGLNSVPFRTITPTPFVIHLLLKDRGLFQNAFSDPEVLVETGLTAELRNPNSNKSSLADTIPEGEVYRPFWSIPREAKAALTFKVINNEFLLENGE